MQNQYAQEAETKLMAAIQRTVGQTQSSIERVMSEVPKDAIVKAQKLQFGHVPVEDGKTSGQVLLMTAPGDDNAWTLHPNAAEQVAAQAGIPKPYFDRLEEGAAWQRALLEDVLNTTYRNSGRQHLVRSIDGQARGFLSDRFKRIDARPLIEVFTQEARRVGAMPYAGVVTDTRVAFKALLPQVHVFEAARGAWRADHQGYSGVEAVALGVEWGNSDYGRGFNQLALTILRIWCLNAATAMKALKQVHLGARLDENIEYSRQTYDLDTKTAISAMRDVMRSLLGPESVQRTVEHLKNASAVEVDFEKIVKGFGQALTVKEREQLTTSFDGPDVVNLPPGKTVWRASNALSWLANAAETTERRLELERMAGAVLKVAA